MDVTKIIKAKIGHSNYVVADPIMKEDYGLYLLIEGIDLPQSYEVDFSNELRDGTSVTMIGDENGVRIPEQFIEPGRNVYAFYYHVGSDFGRTLYTIRIPNRARPERTDETPTPVQQSAIDQAISALNTAVERTAQDVLDADQSAQDASDSADSAVAAKDAAEGYAQNASDSASAAATSATQASASEQGCARAVLDAASAAAIARTRADEASGYAQTASTKASEAALSASSAATSAQTATIKAAEAAVSAASVGEAAQTATAKAAEASASSTSASGSASAAATSASTASTKAAEASASATAAQTAQTAAETAQTAAEDAQEAAETAAESIEASAAQIATNTTDIADVKRDLSDKAPVVIETASGSIASFADGADDMPMKSLIVNIEPVQSGSGDPSPDNVRPISGWTGCEVNVRGKNLFDVNDAITFPITQSGITFNVVDGVVILNGTATAEIGVNALETSLEDNVTYAASATGITANTKVVLQGYKSGSFVGSIGMLTSSSPSLTFDANTTYDMVRARPTALNGATLSDVELRIQIEKGSTATHYESYKGATYPISWQSEAGTVYGGTLDVVSGLLTVDRAMVDFGTLNWTASSSANCFYASDQSLKYAYGDTVKMICSRYKYTGTRSYAPYYGDDGTIQAYRRTVSYPAGELYVHDSNYTDAATFKTAMDGVQLVYELATPQTYQLDPTEVKSILGLNNVWADCGDCEVEYRADTKMFVESQIPDVPVEDVQINGTSIVADGVANVPIGTDNRLGVVQGWPGGGTQILADGRIATNQPSASEIKAGTANYKPISPANQHQSTFYALAKVAGDTTQSQSSNAVGSYTEDAKSAISEMLGGSVSVSGTTPTIVAKSGIRYVCGEISTLDLTPPASGICDVVFTSGSTATVLTVPNTVKWANGFDPTSLDADTTYEINIMDGLGVCVGWT